MGDLLIPRTGRARIVSPKGFVRKQVFQ